MPATASLFDEVSAIQDDESGQFEPVGNFLKTDNSLVVRAKRLKRYSAKYRDSVIARVLHGVSTISEVRHDAKLSEAEIVDWIADKYRRMEKEIEVLKTQNSNETEEVTAPAPVRSSVDELEPETVEGTVKPR